MLRGISQLFKAISTSLVPMHRTVEADAPWTSAFWLRRDHSVWSLAHSWEAGVKGFLWQSWGRNSESGPCKFSDPEPGPNQWEKQKSVKCQSGPFLSNPHFPGN